MQKAEDPGLLLEQLRTYKGFEKMSEEELQEALLFIETMTELLLQVKMKTK